MNNEPPTPDGTFEDIKLSELIPLVKDIKPTGNSNSLFEVKVSYIKDVDFRSMIWNYSMELHFIKSTGSRSTMCHHYTVKRKY